MCVSCEGNGETFSLQAVVLSDVDFWNAVTGKWNTSCVARDTWRCLWDSEKLAESISHEKEKRNNIGATHVELKLLSTIS